MVGWLYGWRELKFATPGSSGEGAGYLSAFGGKPAASVFGVAEFTPR